MRAAWRYRAPGGIFAMNRKLVIAVLLSAFLLVIPTPKLWAEKLSGDYEIRQDGKLVGAERWSVEFSTDGSIVSASTGSAKQGGPKDRIQIDDATELRAGLSGAFQEYEREVSISGLPRRLSMTFDGISFLSRFHSGKNIVERKLKAPAESMVVDVGIFHHYNILVRRARKYRGFSKPIPVIIPSELQKTTAFVDDRGDDPVKIGGVSFQARRYFIDMGLFGLEVWADAKDRLIKIVVPSTGFSAVLTGYRGPKATSPPKPRASSRWMVEKTQAAFPTVATLKGVKEFKLNAVIRRPPNQTQKLPAVIFISDTGPQNAEGVDPLTGLKTLTGEFCDALASSGYIVMSWDDRGIGKSEGDLAAATLDILTKDGLAAMDHLRLFEGADEKRIAVVGLGEGANIAMRMAAQRPEIKAVVALSPSPISLAELAKQQIRRRIETDGGFSDRSTDSHPVMIALKKAAETQKEFTTISGRPVYLDVYRQWLSHNPVADLKSVKASVLHVTSTGDRQVFPDLNKDFIKTGLKMPNYTHKNFKSLDHYLINGRGTLGSYSDPDRMIDADAVGFIVRWLGEKLK